MVISPGTYFKTSSVIIPLSIASSILLPQDDLGNIKLQPIRDGDYAILVCKPVLWSGGIMSVKVKVSEPEIIRTSRGYIDMNRSMNIPLRLCSPHAADFDRNEMSLFPIKNKLSIDECQSFDWMFPDENMRGLMKYVVPKSQRIISSNYLSAPMLVTVME